MKAEASTPQFLKRESKTIRKMRSKGAPPVEVTRFFRASVGRVWKAFKEPELLKQWWGPEGFTAPSAKINFRVGGKYHFAMKPLGGKLIGKVTWSTGTYLRIEPTSLIVCTDQFCDENGKVISASEVGMPGKWPKSLIVTIEFIDADDDEMKLHIKHDGIPMEMREECIDGWDSSLNKLQKLVERN